MIFPGVFVNYPEVIQECKEILMIKIRCDGNQIHETTSQNTVFINRQQPNA